MADDGKQMTHPKKLTIELYADQKFSGEPEVWEVLFNPSEYAFSRANEYNQTQSMGTSRPSTGYGNGTPDELSITLLFDGTGVLGTPGPVTEQVQKILSFMDFQGDTHKPRYLKVVWGPLAFKCFLKSATVTYTMFDLDGQPVRARVAASFEEVLAEDLRVAKERAESPDLLRTWTVESGQTLDGIAYKAYGDVRYWRLLAEANRLANPRALVEGQVLMMPLLER